MRRVGGWCLCRMAVLNFLDPTNSDSTSPSPEIATYKMYMVRKLLRYAPLAISPSSPGSAATAPTFEAALWPLSKFAVSGPSSAMIIRNIRLGWML